MKSHTTPPGGTTGQVPASVLGITRMHAPASPPASGVSPLEVAAVPRHAASPTIAKIKAAAAATAIVRVGTATGRKTIRFWRSWRPDSPYASRRSSIEAPSKSP